MSGTDHTTRRDRIRAKIAARVIIAESGCHIWTGLTSGESGRGRGYPRMSLDGATVAVHITAWIVENGPVPPKKQIDHLCCNRLCVNPAHLEMVTHRTNQRRRDQRRAQFVAEGCSP
jgi:hypothetical protein